MGQGYAYGSDDSSYYENTESSSSQSTVRQAGLQRIAEITTATNTIEQYERKLWWAETADYAVVGIAGVVSAGSARMGSQEEVSNWAPIFGVIAALVDFGCKGLAQYYKKKLAFSQVRLRQLTTQ